MKKLLLTLSVALISSLSFYAQQTGQFNSSVNWTNASGAQSKSMVVYVPTNYSASTSYGLVIGLHGLGDTPSNYIGAVMPYATDAYYGNNIVVATSYGEWSTNPIDEGIIAEIRDKLNITYNIDASSVYVQGFSVGAMSAVYNGLFEAGDVKGIISHSPALCGTDYNYTSASQVKACFTSSSTYEQTIAPGCIVNPTTLDDSFYYIAIATKDSMVANGGDAIFIDNPNSSHSIPPQTVVKQCWTHVSQSVATVNDDAGITSINTPTGTLCSGTITPTVTLKNFGLSNLTSVTINYLVDGNAQTPYAWSGNLAPNGSAIVNLPNISVSNSAHTFNANTTMPNNTADQGPSNDAATQANFTVIGGGASLPFVEGFEGAYLPSGWSANNPDGGITWVKSTLAAKTGNASAFMDYTNYNSGDIDDIITPALNLASVTSPELTFEVAYSLYTDPNDPQPYSDTLEVLVSTDCGSTWTSVYKKYSLALVTATPAFTTAQFIPTANEWRLETISLGAFASSSNAMIMFRGTSDYENSLFIDDINIKGSIPTGIKMSATDENINIFPNPATDVINIFLTDVENVDEITIINIVGEVIYNNTNINSSTNSIDMSAQAKGFYFVRVKSGDQLITKKIMLTK